MGRPLRMTMVLMAAAIAQAAATRTAHASPTYPTLIRQQLGLNYTPPCTICHRDDNGGAGTVVQPFGRALMSLGLTSENPASLTSALEAASAEELDSGGDGVPDIEELQADMDPNAGGNGRPTPLYGCMVEPRGAEREPAVTPVLIAAALALVASTQRRRRARPVPAAVSTT